MNAVHSFGVGSCWGSYCGSYGVAPVASVRKTRTLKGCKHVSRRAILCILVLSLLSTWRTAVANSPSLATQTPAPQAWSCSGVYHAVQRGESIYSIARRFGTTAYRIAVCNGLSSYTVHVGQSLLIPTTRTRTTGTGSIPWPTVQPGR